ncbi:MAG: hypothetical protein KAR79_06235, partial [Simkaniaceae bacterium]|nr:hypothetical protein [Simkaniaceae bacterium]
MNLIPLVSIMLIILSLFTFSFIKNDIVFIAEKEALISHANLERSARNILAKTHHKNIAKKVQEKSSHDKKQGEPKKESLPTPFSYPRSQQVTSSHEKWNLYPLFHKRSPELLIQAFTRMLQNLYG